MFKECRRRGGIATYGGCWGGPFEEVAGVVCPEPEPRISTILVRPCRATFAALTRPSASRPMSMCQCVNNVSTQVRGSDKRGAVIEVTWFGTRT